MSASYSRYQNGKPPLSSMPSQKSHRESLKPNSLMPSPLSGGMHRTGEGERCLCFDACDFFLEAEIFLIAWCFFPCAFRFGILDLSLAALIAALRLAFSAALTCLGCRIFRLAPVQAVGCSNIGKRRTQNRSTHSTGTTQLISS